VEVAAVGDFQFYEGVADLWCFLLMSPVRVVLGSCGSRTSHEEKRLRAVRLLEVAILSVYVFRFQ
jgi:hypothetical protein